MKKYSLFWVFVFIGAIAALVFSFGLIAGDPLYYLAALALVSVLLFLYFQPTIGVFLMAALYPFTLFQIQYSSFNVPMVDVLGMLMLITMALKMYKDWRNGIKVFDGSLFPGVIYYGLFVVAASLSLINVPGELFGLSVKYLFRPIIFIYPIYLLTPIYYIKSKEILISIIKIIYWVGNLIALGGLWTIFFLEGYLKIHSASPFGYGSFYPLGYNHNQLSEVLVVTFMLGIGLYLLEKDYSRKRWYLIGALFQAGVAFLTFSRAGWMAMMIQLLILVYLLYKDQVKMKLYKIWNWILISASVPFVLLLYYLNSTDIAQGSNLNRIKLIQIAWSLFIEHPLIGSGIGTFFKAVEQVRWYILEYGMALDAHGFFFKVLAETGVLGITAFVGFLAYTFYNIFMAYRRTGNPEMKMIILILLISALGGLIFQWFGTSYYVATMWWPIGIALAAVRISKERSFNLRG